MDDNDLSRRHEISEGEMDTRGDELDRLEFDIWRRLLKELERRLPAETARSMLKIGFPKKDVARMRRLTAKSKNGGLSDLEQLEVAAYCRVGSLLSIVKSKARRSLGKVSAKRG